MIREPLSAAGASRRDAMLDELLDSMRDLHATRRRRRRIVAATGSGLAVVVVAIAAWRGVARPNPSPAPGPPLVANRVVLEVEHVRTDPDILARCRPATTFRAEIIDDTELLQTLRAMNRPTGLVRVDGETRLTERVTDS